MVHFEGRISPKDDIETINTELILADLQTVDNALPRLRKEARLVKDKQALVTAAERAQDVLDAGRTVFAAGLDTGPLRELHLLTAKPFLYVFNMDDEELTNEALKSELRGLVAPAEAIFLDAKIEHELAELSDDDALELLQSMGQEESGLSLLGGRVRHPGPADLSDGGTEGIARLDDPQEGNGAGSRGCHPHRLPTRLHQGGGGHLRRARRRRIDGRGESARQGPHRGQGLRHARGDVVEFRFGSTSTSKKADA